jgi:transcriptional regulator with XRE-family HTH domain
VAAYVVMALEVCVVSSPIGERVARLRVLRGWSREQLAHQAGISVDTVRKLESGNRDMMRLAAMSRIASALDVELAVT